MGLSRPVGWRYFSSSHQEALAEEVTFEQKPDGNEPGVGARELLNFGQCGKFGSILAK